MFTETLSTWCTFGETTLYCEAVVKAYCKDKHDRLKDPGCFVQNDLNASQYDYEQYLHYTTSDIHISHKLDYFCGDLNCYGVGSNFGGPNATLACSDPGSTDDGDDIIDDNIGSVHF
jgi:hypothetical protein